MLLLGVALAFSVDVVAASPAATAHEGEQGAAFGGDKSLAHAEIVEEMEIVTHADGAAHGVRDTYDDGSSLPHGREIRVSLGLPLRTAVPLTWYCLVISTLAGGAEPPSPHC